MNNPKAADNLKPFKKGDDSRRNINGQPRKIPKLEELLAEVLGGDDNNNSGAIQILKKLHSQAKAGNVKAAEILLDRGYGKPKQTIDQTNLVTLTNFKVKDILDFDTPEPEV